MTPFQNQQSLQPQRRVPLTAQVKVPQDRRPFAFPRSTPYCPISLSSGSRQLRLVDGDSPCAGRVEILDQASWGTICDDGWDLNDPAWCAGSWAVEKPSNPLSLLPLGRDQGPFGWATWSAQERSPTCGGALPGAGGSTTVITVRMQESSAQVWSVHAHQRGEWKFQESWCLIGGTIGDGWAREDWDNYPSSLSAM